MAHLLLALGPWLKGLSIVLSGVAGVYALVHDFKRDGRITREGYVGIFFIGLAVVVSLTIHTIELSESRRRARLEAQATTAEEVRRAEATAALTAAQSLVAEISLEQMSAFFGSDVRKLAPDGMHVGGLFELNGEPLLSVSGELNELGIGEGKDSLRVIGRDEGPSGLRLSSPEGRTRAPTYDELRRAALWLRIELTGGTATASKTARRPIGPPEWFQLRLDPGGRRIYRFQWEPSGGEVDYDWVSAPDTVSRLDAVFSR